MFANTALPRLYIHELRVCVDMIISVFVATALKRELIYRPEDAPAGRTISAAWSRPRVGFEFPPEIRPSVCKMSRVSRLIYVFPRIALLLRHDIIQCSLFIKAPGDVFNRRFHEHQCQCFATSMEERRRQDEGERGGGGGGVAREDTEERGCRTVSDRNSFIRHSLLGLIVSLITVMCRRRVFKWRWHEHRFTCDWLQRGWF